jgi:hypothetical protein
MHNQTVQFPPLCLLHFPNLCPRCSLPLQRKDERAMSGNFRLRNFVSNCNNECGISQCISSFSSSAVTLIGFLMSMKYFMSLITTKIHIKLYLVARLTIQSHFFIQRRSLNLVVPMGLIWGARWRSG